MSILDQDLEPGKGGIRTRLSSLYGHQDSGEDTELDVDGVKDACYSRVVLSQVQVALACRLQTLTAAWQKSL